MYCRSSTNSKSSENDPAVIGYLQWIPVKCDLHQDMQWKIKISFVRFD